MFFIARIWDALNDIFMGTIVDNTRSRFGKFKPWLVIGTLVNVVVYILLFTRFGGISAKGMYVCIRNSILYSVGNDLHDHGYSVLVHASQSYQ